MVGSVKVVMYRVGIYKILFGEIIKIEGLKNNLKAKDEKIKLRMECRKKSEHRECRDKI